MPAPELFERYQAAVLWEKAGKDRYNEATVAAPVEIRVRWSNKQTQALDPQGNTVTVDATVVTALSVPIGSILWQGTLRDYNNPASTSDKGALMEVITSAATPDLKNRFTQRTLGLKFYRAELPDLAS